MFSYPSIVQFRNVVRSVKYDNREENIDFIRTTKIHGSNCSVVLDLQDNKLSTQSRNSVITPEDDYRGFAKFVESNKSDLLELFDDYLVLSEEPKPLDSTHIIFYGEWGDVRMEC